MGKNHIVLHISANCKARVIGQSYRSHSGSRRERGSLIQLVVSCEQLLARNLVGLVGQKRASRRSESLCHSSSKPTSGPEQLPDIPHSRDRRNTPNRDHFSTLTSGLPVSRSNRDRVPQADLSFLILSVYALVLTCDSNWATSP